MFLKVFLSLLVRLQVQAFFGTLTKETGAELRCLQQSLESIEENIRWMDKNLPLLQEWLDRRGPKPGAMARTGA